MSAVLIGVRGFYMQIYQVGDTVREIACQILFAFAVIAPVKVLNMILGAGIIRSGGKTKVFADPNSAIPIFCFL